jgi:hypothetical protein
MRLVLLAAGAGCVAVVAAMLLLQAFAVRPNSFASQLREDDLVCLMEAAWAGGTAAFSFWSTRTRIQWFCERNQQFALVSAALTALSSFTALTLLGFVIERHFDESLQAPSLRAVSIAGVGALAVALWQRQSPPRQRSATRD